MGVVFKIHQLYGSEHFPELVQHSLVIQKNNIEQKPQRGSCYDNREKINRAEKLLPLFNIIHHKCKHDRYAELAHNRRRYHFQRIDQRRPYIGVFKKFYIICKPWVVPSFCGRTQIINDPAVQYILEKRIVQKNSQKSKGRDQKENNGFFILINIGTHNGIRASFLSSGRRALRPVLM